MTTVNLNGKPLKLEAKRIIGQGGEAVIYDIGNDLVFKLYKQPDHPDFTNQPDIQRAVRERLEEYQTKLMAFPTSLPPEVITPMASATDMRSNRILGYSMKKIVGATELIRYSDKAFRRSTPVDVIPAIMRNLHATLKKIHAIGVVIGDFNDLNILVQGTGTMIIDTDSFQFGHYLCRMFTERFVDPMLCTIQDSIMLSSPHRETSDWYAYACMLMQLLLYVGPYGGIHKPSQSKHRMGHRERLAERMTVFHPDIAYPKPALHYSMLPDDLIHEFTQIFTRDKRGVFPQQLLTTLRFQQCPTCSLFHARSTCPSCITPQRQIVKEHITIRGTVTATRIFKTTRIIIHATARNGTLQWITYEQGAFKREQGTLIVNGKTTPDMQYGIVGTDTIIASKGIIERYGPSGQRSVVQADLVEGQTQFATDGESLYWVEQGRVLKDDTYEPRLLGTALAGYTRFWTGPAFGFGFYRAGTLAQAFIAKPIGSVLNDSVRLPQIRGRIINANCRFSKDLCWFTICTDEYGTLMQRTYLINARGVILAQAEGNAANTSWLSSFNGSCAIGPFLFVPTDRGIVRVEQSGSDLVVTREFPDTENFVDADCTLLPCQGGIAVVSAHEITTLTL